MSHDYMLLFTDTNGTYQGTWAIQSFTVRARIDEIQKLHPTLFDGTWYQPIIDGQYSAMKIKVHHDTVKLLESIDHTIIEEHPWLVELEDPIKSAIKNDLNLFLI